MDNTYVNYAIKSIPGQALVAFISILFKISLLKNGQIFQITYRPIKKNDRKKAMIVFVIRLFFQILIKIIVKYIYTKKNI